MRVVAAIAVALAHLHNDMQSPGNQEQPRSMQRFYGVLGLWMTAGVVSGFMGHGRKKRTPCAHVMLWAYGHQRQYRLL